MHVIEDKGGAIALMIASLLFLGTWPAVFTLLERRGRLPQHTYLDYSITNLMVAILIALTFGQIGDSRHNQPNFFTQLSQDNWHSVLFAMAGGILLSLGNLSTQYALAFVGLSVTEVMTCSITVVIGTTMNYFLDGRINKAEILFPGVGCFLVAVFLGSAVHSSNAADNKEKLSGSTCVKCENACAWGDHKKDSNEPKKDVTRDVEIGTYSASNPKAEKSKVGTAEYLIELEEQRSIKVVGSNMFLGLAIVFFAGICFSLFSPAFNLATNDQWHTLKKGVPHLVVYTAFFYFSISCFVLAIALNVWFLYWPILGLPRSSLKAYVQDWNGRQWALLAGLLCGFGNGFQFMGGQAAGYAAADAVQDKVCRTCGHPGFVDSIATCSLCKVSCEHPYCMDLVRYEVPKDWRCEECLRIAEAVSNINLPVHQFSHKITSRKIGAGKVKFITNKEVVTLTSGKRSHGKGNPRATGHRSDFAYVKPSPLSWKKVTPSRPKKGPDYAGVDISAPEHTMTSKPFNKKKDSMCADEGLMSMVDKHIENKTALKPQDDYSFIDEPPNASLAIKGERALHMEKDANVLPFNDSENKAPLKRHDDYLFIDEQANASLSVKVERDVQPNNDSVAQHPLNIDGRHCCTFYPTFTQILSQKMVLPLKLVISSDEKHHHAVEACWRGAFEVLDFGTQFHGTVTAHLPCQVSPKVYDISKHLPGTLQFKMLARESVWPKIFKLDPPTKDDVALYFRCEVERHKEKYVHFIQHIDFHDYALQGCVSDVELLLLSSAQLQIDSQYLGGDIYLWGVFRHLKEKKASHEEEKAVSFSPSTPTAHITQGHSKVPLEVNSPEVAREVDKLRGSLDSKVDMEIDMIGGCSMGRIDVVSIKLEDAPPGFSKPIQRSPTSFGLKKCTDPLFLGAPPGFPFPAYRRSVPAALGKPTIASSSTTTNYGLADSTGK